MAEDTTQSHQAGLPAALETCLREDACVRADGLQLQRMLAEVRAPAVQAREATALPGRLLAALGRRKDGPATPAEAAEILAREQTLQRQGQESERLGQHYTGMLNSHLTAYLQAAVPGYREQTRARLRLTEWENLIVDLRADLRQLIKMLGQARNNAVAGYDKATNKMSATAREMFGQSSGLIRQVDTRVRQANDKAAEIGGLPRVAIIPLQETVNSLMQLEIVTMLREFDRVVRELEQFEQRQLQDLLLPAIAAADALVAQSQAYLAQYREQLRAYYDGQITPAEVTAAIPLIRDRFRRGEL